MDRSFCLLTLFAVAYGMVMLVLDGTPLTQLYSASPYHRYQAEALLEGHLYLANSVDAIRPGLAWHNGQVQQVWGLGVGYWLLPFQAVWRLLGGHMFPDRIALGVAFALLAFYAGHTGLKIIQQNRRATGLGFIWLVVLCPPLWTLTRASESVFEQTILYSVVFSLGILVSLVRVAWFGSPMDYVVCFALSAFTIWVRPTHAIYGLIATVICSSVLLLRHRAMKTAVLGTTACIVSFGLLAWTNYERFGSPTEFGHRLTVSTGNMVFLTRFGNPFQEAPPLDAARELAGLMFLDSNVRDANAFSKNLFAGQASATRWRKLNITAFDPSYAIMSLLAVGGMVFWFARRLKEANRLPVTRPVDVLVASLFLWSIVSATGLSLFYLYYPAMASRYLFDFAPALIGFASLLWVLVSTRWGGFLWPLLALWIAYEIMVAKVPVQTQHLGSYAHAETVLPQIQNVSLEQFRGVYTLAHHPGDTGISWNGRGWEPDNGFTEDIVVLAVDKPQYVELQVDERREFNGEPARKDVYRAMIDGVLLPQRQLVRENDELRVVFDIPPSLRVRLNNEVLFLCFSEGYDMEDRDSERFLYSVRWK